MKAQIIDEAEEGLTTLEGEFYTEHFVIRGAITSPELRLSDHLNSATSTLELTPQFVQRLQPSTRIDIADTCTYITKSHLLIAVPLAEPDFPPSNDNRSWLRTMSQTCWAAIGRYSLVGKIHMEAGRNPRLFLRSIEQRQFLPLTDARLTFPDGTTRSYGAVVVNRFHLELLALQGDTGN